MFYYKGGAGGGDLEIVVDPGNPIPRNKMRVAETFGLNSRYLVVNSDICRESYYSVMDHLGFCRTISSILSGNCLKFFLENTIDRFSVSYNMKPISTHLYIKTL